MAAQADHEQATRVVVPIRVRVDPATVDAPDELNAAVRRGLTRALTSARVHLHGRPVRARRPQFTWMGSHLSEVSSDRRARVERTLRDAITDMLVATLPTAATGRSGRVKRPSAPASRAASTAHARSHAASHDAELRLRLRADDRTTRSAALREVLPRLDDGDWDAFVTLLWAIRPDDSVPTDAIIGALRAYARAHRATFIAFLRAALRLAPMGTAPKIQRLANDIHVTFERGLSEEAGFERLDVIAGAVRVARAIPEAAEVLREWSHVTPGVDRLIALTDALAAVRVRLYTYLTGAAAPPGQDAAPAEDTEAGVLAAIATGTMRLLRIPALIVSAGGDAGVARMVYDLEVDLGENIRWIEHVLAQTQEIDASLSSYRLVYGATAKTQDEVVALLESRFEYLSRIADNFLPTAEYIRTLRKYTDGFYAEWTGRAGDAKAEKSSETARQLREALGAMHALTQLVPKRSDHLTTFVEAARGHTTWFNERYANTLTDLSEIALALQQARNGPRNETYPAQLRRIEQRVTYAVVHVLLLQVASYVRDMEESVLVHDIGDIRLQIAWLLTVGRLQFDVQSQWSRPDFEHLQQKREQWARQLEFVRDWINREARFEVFVHVGVALLAIVVTWGVGSVLAAADVGVVGISLAEAGAVTTVTALGAVVVGKPLSVREIGVEFVLNAAMFRLMRLVHGALVARAVRIPPEHVVLRLAAVFGGDFAVGLGLSLSAEALRTGELPQHVSVTVALNLVLNVMVAAFTGPQVMAELARAQRELEGRELQEIVSIARELVQLRSRHDALQQHIDAAVGRRMTAQEAAASRRAEAEVFGEVEELALKTSRLSQATLERFHMTRDGLERIALDARAYRDECLTGPLVTRATSPVEATDGLIVLREGVFEFNPNARDSSVAALTPKLHRAGYEVRTEGDVLILTPRSDPAASPVRVIPSTPDVLSPALAAIVGGPRTLSARGLTVLREQRAAPGLESSLTALGMRDRLVTRTILEGIGRHLESTEARALQGIEHFVSIGGDPRALAIALGRGRERDSPSVLRALAQFNNLTAADLPGFDVIIATLGTGPAATDTIAAIGANFSDARSVYGALADIAPHTDGSLREVLRYLRSLEQPNLNQAALGSLIAARRLLIENPGARLAFEIQLTRDGRLVRVVDVQVRLPAGNPLGFIQAEVKEVLDTGVLRFNAHRQMAVDIREALRNPPPPGYRPLARVRWLIREPNVKTAAQMESIRADIRETLKRAFNDPRIVNEPGLPAAREDFERNFAEIVQFLGAPGSTPLPPPGTRSIALGGTRELEPGEVTQLAAEVYAATVSEGDPRQVFYAGARRLNALTDLTSKTKLAVLESFLHRMNVGFSRPDEGAEHYVIYSPDGRSAYRLLKVTGQIEYGRLSPETQTYAFEQIGVAPGGPPTPTFAMPSSGDIDPQSAQRIADEVYASARVVGSGGAPGELFAGAYILSGRQDLSAAAKVDILMRFMPRLNYVFRGPQETGDAYLLYAEKGETALKIAKGTGEVLVGKPDPSIGDYAWQAIRAPTPRR
jgi:hypothetical protein